jgi:hypothetical protein
VTLLAIVVVSGLFWLVARLLDAPLDGDDLNP